MTQEAIEKNSGRRRRGNTAEDVLDEEVEAIEEEMDDDDDESGVSYTERKGRATPGKRSRQVETQEKGNFIVRFLRGIRNYLRGVKEELEKVVWPTREELIRLSRIILIVTIFTALVLGALAILFNELFKIGFENNLVFLFFFAGVGILYVIGSRFFKSTDTY